MKDIPKAVYREPKSTFPQYDADLYSQARSQYIADLEQERDALRKRVECLESPVGPKGGARRYKMFQAPGAIMLVPDKDGQYYVEKYTEMDALRKRIEELEGGAGRCGKRDD